MRFRDILPLKIVKQCTVCTSVTSLLHIQWSAPVVSMNAIKNVPYCLSAWWQFRSTSLTVPPECLSIWEQTDGQTGLKKKKKEEKNPKTWLEGSNICASLGKLLCVIWLDQSVRLERRRRFRWWWWTVSTNWPTETISFCSFSELQPEREHDQCRSNVTRQTISQSDSWAASRLDWAKLNMKHCCQSLSRYVLRSP